MSEPAPEQPKFPHCPNCNAEMPTLGLFTWAIPPAVIICFHCPVCYAALHFTAGGQQAAPSPIARPH